MASAYTAQFVPEKEGRPSFSTDKKRGLKFLTTPACMAACFCRMAHSNFSIVMGSSRTRTPVA